MDTTIPTNPTVIPSEPTTGVYSHDSGNLLPQIIEQDPPSCCNLKESCHCQPLGDCFDGTAKLTSRLVEQICCCSCCDRPGDYQFSSAALFCCYIPAWLCCGCANIVKF